MWIFILLTLLLASPKPSTSTSLPSVKLGYETHTANFFNTTGSYYVFSNIPYAEQPVGSRRFKTPVLPTGSSSTNNNGGPTPIACMQSLPNWQADLEAAQAGVPPSVILQQLATASGMQTEACLMLDVYVPDKVLKLNNGVPVIVLIHGGGYTFGSKTSNGVPSGLLSRATQRSNKGVVIVAINYRLGMFGWLANPSSPSVSASLTPNLGLYDQRVALQWVATYISRFGGDPSQVTVIGQSAGASSILHQLTAYGGANSPPFNRAVLQSPAYQFNLDAAASYALVLQAASRQTGVKVTSVSGLSRLGTADLEAVNQAVTGDAELGFYNFGPVVDGSYVPDTPQVLLYHGRVKDSVPVMAAHNSFESGAFLLQVTTATQVHDIVAAALSKASNATLNYILNTLYPSSAYGSEYERVVHLSSELGFTCVTRDLANALDDDTYNYYFAMPPGFHGEDLAYTFSNGAPATTPAGFPVNLAVARQLQDYLVGFAMQGNPDRSPAGNTGTPPFPQYGRSAKVMTISPAGFAVGTDDDANPRCDWWQQAMVKGLI